MPEQLICEGVAYIVPPTATSQMKGFYYDRKKEGLQYYTPKEVVEAELVWRHALEDMRTQFGAAVAGAIRLEFGFFWPYPATFPKWIKELDQIPKTTKPDLDNIIKLVQDVMKSLNFFVNDSQVADGHGAKWYAKVPRVEMRMWQIIHEKAPSKKRTAAKQTEFNFCMNDGGNEDKS